MIGGPPPVVERRTIRGASAVLLPLTATGAVDLPALEAHLSRTVAAGLVPAVNMDTGFGPYLGESDRQDVLRLTASCAGEFIAGVHSDDQPGEVLDLDDLFSRTAAVAATGALPILFPSHALAALPEDELVEVHRRLADEVGQILGFELGPMFHPAGRIYSAPVFEQLLGIDGVVGLKHSSLRRDLEWERIRIRDRVRPEFRLMTGNDLAIDMVVHGSDYLLGLSTFAPDGFAARDLAWERGDVARFWELNDLLQYLGQFAFRPPVPAYRHDAAMFLQARGQLSISRSHDLSPARSECDLDVLLDIANRLDTMLDLPPVSL